MAQWGYAQMCFGATRLSLKKTSDSNTTRDQPPVEAGPTITAISKSTECPWRKRVLSKPSIFYLYHQKTSFILLYRLKTETIPVKDWANVRSTLPKLITHVPHYLLNDCTAPIICIRSSSPKSLKNGNLTSLSLTSSVTGQSPGFPPYLRPMSERCSGR